MDATHADTAIARAAATPGTPARATASTFAYAAANEGLGGVNSRAVATWRSESATFNTSKAPMKTETQARADLSHIAQMIEGIPIAMLTTIESDGTLASRPMAPLEMDATGALWFFIDLRSAKVEHLKVANLTFSDTTRGTYVLLSGRGEIDTNRGRIESLWTPMAKPWFPEGSDLTALALLKFVPNVADYWDASNSRMVRAFSLMASATTGKPIAMGEHGSHTGLSSAPVTRGDASRKS
jgi:general stress protein 26